jgi:hypothetical protein
MKDILTMMRVITGTGIKIDTIITEAEIIIQEGHAEVTKGIVDKGIGTEEVSDLQANAAALCLLKGLLESFKDEWGMK